MPEKQAESFQTHNVLTMMLVVALAALVIIPAAVLNRPPSTESSLVAAEVPAEYTLQYLPEDVDVVFVQYNLEPDGPERALNEIKKTRNVLNVIAVGDKAYIFLLEKAKYLP